ncbi:hypothetical protein Ccrd_003652 [Cynara cardunculus var. scolymus]|uniref:Uncharacterized protein n=1 Tax=Cynara cardunculus var. scolymus TaxID=59895 RepID=A0A124SCM2_CYNCS|nr:hypothetical protein Ccrd_003652 [Cynara cardunculus var. scolymus]
MNHSRRQLPPVAPHKRKERDETFDFLKPSTPIIRSSSSKLAKPKPFAPGPRPMAPIKPFKAADTLPANNILLAGYLAHEFLTKGTLFGQSYDPAHAKPAPALSAASSAVVEENVNEHDMKFENCMCIEVLYGTCINAMTCVAVLVFVG